MIIQGIWTTWGGGCDKNLREVCFYLSYHISINAVIGNVYVIQILYFYRIFVYTLRKPVYFFNMKFQMKGNKKQIKWQGTNS